MGLALADLYAKRIAETLATVIASEGEQVAKAAAMVRERRAQDGIVHVFGSGHSQSVAIDATYRAASPAWVNGVLDPSLSVVRGAQSASAAEDIAENARPIFLQERPTAADVTVVVCNSGTTPVSVAWAKACADRGIPVISIVSKLSLSYFSRLERPSLDSISDVLIDNHCPVGDGIIQEERDSAPRNINIGPSSTIVNVFILHWVLVKALEGMIERGEEVQTFRSGHLEGASAQNAALMEAYRGRIRVY